MMMVRGKQGRVHREATVTQARVNVNGKSAQMCRAVQRDQLVDLLQAAHGCVKGNQP